MRWKINSRSNSELFQLVSQFTKDYSGGKWQKNACFLKEMNIQSEN